jgi:hypothetical protein
MPAVYTGAQYTILKTGTKTNGSHWQFTAKCTGCSTYTSSGRTAYLATEGTNRLAFAYAAGKPSNPSSNASTFPVHDVHNYWSHDFAGAKNADFASLVTKNGVR